MRLFLSLLYSCILAAVVLAVAPDMAFPYHSSKQLILKVLIVPTAFLTLVPHQDLIRARTPSKITKSPLCGEWFGLRFPRKKPGYRGIDCSRVNEPLEDPAVLRKEGSVGPRYTGASGKSLEALLFYGVVVVGDGCRSRPVPFRKERDEDLPLSGFRP